MSKVTICMPNYNYGHFIEQAVLSAFNQNYGDLELIVVDDGSTDNSLQKLEKLEINAPIPMKILNGNHRGVSAAMNLALSHASGDWIAMFHSDDYSDPSRITKQVNAIKEGDVIIHTDFKSVDPKGINTGYSSSSDLPACNGESLQKLLLYKADVRSMTIMFNKEKLLESGGFDEELPVEDWQLILKLSSVGKISHVPEELVYRRIHSQNISFTSHKKKTKFSFNEIALDVLEKVIPLNMNKEKIITIHICNVLRNSIALGGFRKSIDCIRKTYNQYPNYIYLLLLTVFESIPSFIWINFLRPFLPKEITILFSKGKYNIIKIFSF